MTKKEGASTIAPSTNKGKETTVVEIDYKAEMLGKRWYLDHSLFPQDVAISPQQEPYLELMATEGKEVKISGFSGCNNFSGIGTLEDLKFGGVETKDAQVRMPKELAVTKKACESAYLTSLESMILGVLGNEKTTFYNTYNAS